MCRIMVGQGGLEEWGSRRVCTFHGGWLGVGPGWVGFGLDGG